RDYLLPGPRRGRRAVRLPPVRLKERGSPPKRTGVQRPTLQPLNRPSLPRLAQRLQQEGDAARAGEVDVGGGVARQQRLYRLLPPDLAQRPQQEGDAARVGEVDVGGGVARQQRPHRLLPPDLVQHLQQTGDAVRGGEGGVGGGVAGQRLFCLLPRAQVQRVRQWGGAARV